MKLPFDPLLVYYLLGTGIIFGGSAIAWYWTHSQFFVWMAVFAILASLFFCYFFRDPFRDVPREPGLVVSAADGRVLAINRVTENDFVKGEAWQVIIFLSPLDVHVNRAPVAGTIEWTHFAKGAHKPAFAEDAGKNEQNSVGLVTPDGERFLIRQIVGTLARRIVCRVQKNDQVERGERFGIIQFGSRTDVFIPIQYDIRVKLNDRVKGGETILGARP